MRTRHRHEIGVEIAEGREALKNDSDEDVEEHEGSEQLGWGLEVG